MIYFDTAYLLKCYVKESGWEEARGLARQHERVACSIYGKMEVHAALHRKLREGDLLPEQLKTIFQQLDLDENQRLWIWLPLTESIIAGVISAIRSIPGQVFLRTADALHLVTAENNRFREIYSNDTHLLAAAGHFGLIGKNVIDPA
jgi:hypothetical protein